MILTVTGSWCIAAVRLEIVRRALNLENHETTGFVLELVFFTLIFFGLLTALSVLKEIRTRINRIDVLGEQEW